MLLGKRHPVLYLDFNSIKVRLELSYMQDSNLRPLFQFHKGAIRTIVSFVII